jgi:hypothetical protein
LSQEEDAVVAIPHLDVYPNGFRVNVAILLNPRRAHEIQGLVHRGPMGMVRVGVEFADGRVGGRGLRRGPFDLPKDDQGVPTQPYVGFGGGGGGTGGWRFGAWVYPLPPDGPLKIVVGLPPPANSESAPRSTDQLCAPPASGPGSSGADGLRRDARASDDQTPAGASAPSSRRSTM